MSVNWRGRTAGQWVAASLQVFSKAGKTVGIFRRKEDAQFVSAAPAMHEVIQEVIDLDLRWSHERLRERLSAIKDSARAVVKEAKRRRP